jgi:hypothetical protein
MTESNGKKYETANELLRRAWRESVIARVREVEQEFERVREQLEQIRGILTDLTKEEEGE